MSGDAPRELPEARLLTWRQARELLTASGYRGANEAQDVLDDLAHFRDRKFSVRVGEEIWLLSCAGGSSVHGPNYSAEVVKAA